MNWQQTRSTFFFCILSMLLLPGGVAGAKGLPKPECTKETAEHSPDWKLFFKACDELLQDDDTSAADRTELLYLRGLSLYNLLDLERAYKDLRAVLKKDPAHVAVRDLLPLVVLALGGTYLDAAKYLHDSLLSEPQRARTYYGLGRLAQNDGRYNEALKFYGRAIELDPNFAWARYHRARINEDSRRWKNVVSDTSYIIANKDKMGDLGKIDLFQRKVDLYVVVNMVHGYALRRLSRFRESEAALNKLVEHNKSAAAYIARAENLKGMPIGFGRRPRFEEAVRDARKAIELDPEMSEGYRQLGQLLNFMGRPDQAVGFQQKAISLHREDHYSPSLYWELASSQRNLGRFQDAVGTASRAVELANKYNHRFLGDLVDRLTARGYYQKPDDKAEEQLAFTDAITACMYDVRC